MAARGLIKNDDRSLEDFVLKQQQAEELPLYQRGLIGIGALVASMCFFLMIAFSLRVKEEGFVLFGLFYVGVAIGFQKVSGRKNSILNCLFIQSSFSFMGTGKILFAIGLGQTFDSGWGATAAFFILTLGTYHIFRSSLDRFFSSSALFLSIVMNVLWGESSTGHREILFNGVILGLLVATAALLANGKMKRDYLPLLHGLLFSLCLSTLFIAARATFGGRGEPEVISSWFINVLFTLALLAVITWLAGGVKKINTARMRWAWLGVVLLGVVGVPGILLAMTLMVLGYARHEKIMALFGALLTPVFLFYYYYNLDISLLQKSGVLVASGATLLLSRFYLHYRGWHKGGTT